MKELDAFLNRIPPKKFFASEFYKTYMRTLDLYWQQRRRDALALLSQTIAQDIDHIDIHIFYRLWIEILSETRDRPSLQLLKNHLAKMAPDFEDYDQWASLRGLVHLELEELEACAIIVRSVSENTFSPYAMELCQRYAMRFAEDGQTPMHLLECQAPITDFCVLQSLARGLLANSKTTMIEGLLPKVSEVFPKSPLEEHFKFWQSFDQNRLSDCAKIGESLCKRFPKNEQFRFSLGYVKFCQNQVPAAIATLEAMSTKTRASDPDTLALLGYGYLLESHDKVQSKQWDKAKTYFKLAKKQAKTLGIPSSEVTLNLSYMKDKETKKRSTDHRNAKFWTASISPRRESELMTCSQKDADYLFYKVGTRVRENDFVFFIPDKSLRRVLAVYKVTRKSVWHPFEKDQALLELVHRFDRSVILKKFQAGERPGIIELDQTELHSWLDQLEEVTPIRNKLNAPQEKVRQWQLRKIS